MKDATKDTFKKWATWAIAGAKSLPVVPSQTVNTNTSTSESNPSPNDIIEISPKEIAKKRGLAQK